REAFAGARFPGAPPLGQRLRFPTDSALAPLTFEVVGLARDARVGDLVRNLQAGVYLPFSAGVSAAVGPMVYEIRTASDPWSYAEPVREVVRHANSRVPVTRLTTQAQLIDQTIGRQLLLSRLCAGFALLALVIAIVGLYGTVLYDVSRRTAEIGIRMALGADRRRVIRMVLGDVVALAFVGLAIGIPGALSAARFAEAFLFGVTGRDPLTLAVASGLLVAAALAGAYVPARAGRRLIPTAAPRHE